MNSFRAFKYSIFSNNMLPNLRHTCPSSAFPSPALDGNSSAVSNAFQAKSNPRFSSLPFPLPSKPIWYSHSPSKEYHSKLRSTLVKYVSAPFLAARQSLCSINHFTTSSWRSCYRRSRGLYWK